MTSVDRVYLLSTNFSNQFVQIGIVNSRKKRCNYNLIDFRLLSVCSYITMYSTNVNSKSLLNLCN